MSCAVKWAEVHHHRYCPQKQQVGLDILDYRIEVGVVGEVVGAVGVIPALR